MEKIYQTGKKPLARNNKNKLASYQTLTRRLFSLFGTSVCFFQKYRCVENVSLAFDILDIFHAMDSGLSVECGFWIPIVTRILDSLSCIPDTKAQDSRFHKQKFLEFPHMELHKLNIFRSERKYWSGPFQFQFYVLFSQYRARDVHMRICLWRFHIKVIRSGTGRNVKKKGPMAKITWSEMEKQLVHAN